MDHRRIRLAVALFAAIGILLTACSDEGDAADGAPASSARPPEGDRPPRQAATTLDADEVDKLEPEACAKFKTIIEAGPSQPLVPGAVTAETKQQILDDLDAAVAAAPSETQAAMEVFADAYRQVVDELAALEGDLADPTDVNPGQLERINGIMTSPEVVEATAQIQAWTQQC